MRGEQLKLAGLDVRWSEPIAVVIIIADAESDDPKILLAQRNSGPEAGRYTLPGGKIIGRRSPVREAGRELEEETGLKPYANEYLIEAGSGPYSIMSGGKQRKANVFYCFADEAFETVEPENREPDKNGQWTWFGLKEVAALMQMGLLTPKWLIPEWIEAAREARMAIEVLDDEKIDVTKVWPIAMPDFVPAWILIRDEIAWGWIQ